MWGVFDSGEWGGQDWPVPVQPIETDATDCGGTAKSLRALMPRIDWAWLWGIQSQGNFWLDVHIWLASFWLRSRWFWSPE
jgi:hypothetical protein